MRHLKPLSSLQLKSCSTLFGGPAQPTPVDERGGIRAASQKAMESESICSPNQYQNDNVR